jgi:hypothetical protein
MRHDLTAVFNNLADAQHVLDELLCSGFPRSRTLLVSPPKPADTSGAPDAGHGSMLRQIVARLFGRWQGELESVDESAFLPGRHVITLTGADDVDSVRAIDIMERSNPVYIEDRRKRDKRAPSDVAPRPPVKLSFRAHKRSTGHAGPADTERTRPVPTGGIRPAADVYCFICKGSNPLSAPSCPALR